MTRIDDRREEYERRERILDPHRDEEREAVVAEVRNRLGRRGLRLAGTESSSQLAELLDAVERFDDAVEQLGGDLMVDTPPSHEPDSELFVIPQRESSESMPSYLGRLDAATRRLRREMRNRAR